MSDLKAKEYKLFEEIKHLSKDGDEYWYARELAIIDHFAEVSKTTEYLTI